MSLRDAWSRLGSPPRAADAPSSPARSRRGSGADPAPDPVRARRVRDAPVVGAAAPDAMFHTQGSALAASARAWWCHLRYILPFAALVVAALYALIASVRARCGAGLTRDVFVAEGQMEITRRWHRCYNPNFSDDAFRPISGGFGAFSSYVIRMFRLWSTFATDNAYLAHMFAWNMHPATRSRSTVAYFCFFAVFFLAPLIDYELTGFKHMASWCVSVGAFIAAWLTVASDARMRDPTTMGPFSFLVVYNGFGAFTYAFAVAFMNVSSSPKYPIGLKLVIRFVFDPMIWEGMKTAQRHVALLNPSPGAGLNTAYFMGPIINQATYSRLLLFMMTNDGAIDLLTVQVIISLNELMMNLTLKHRDAFFTRHVFGTVTADAVLSSDKSDEIHAMSCLANTFCELASVAFLSSLMAVFALPSSPDAPGGDPSATRTTDTGALAVQAGRLLALELALSFVSAFAQFRFHDIDLARVVPDDEDRKERASGDDPRRSWFGSRARVPSRRFWAYVLMAVFFFACVTGTVLGTLFSVAVCPRVRRSDGHLYFSYCEREEGKHFPGGAMGSGSSLLAMQFDWPPWKSPYAVDHSDPAGERVREF